MVPQGKGVFSVYYILAVSVSEERFWRFRFYFRFLDLGELSFMRFSFSLFFQRPAWRPLRVLEAMCHSWPTAYQLRPFPFPQKISLESPKWGPRNEFSEFPGPGLSQGDAKGGAIKVCVYKQTQTNANKRKIKELNPLHRVLQGTPPRG